MLVRFNVASVDDFTTKKTEELGTHEKRTTIF